MAKKKKARKLPESGQRVQRILARSKEGLRHRSATDRKKTEAFESALVEVLGEEMFHRRLAQVFKRRIDDADWVDELRGSGDEEDARLAKALKASQLPKTVKQLVEVYSSRARGSSGLRRKGSRQNWKPKGRGRSPLNGTNTMTEQVHVRLDQDLHERLLELQGYAGTLTGETVPLAALMRALLFGSDKARNGKTSVRLYLRHLESLRAEQAE